MNLRWVNNLHITILMLPLDLLWRGEMKRMIITQLQEPLNPPTRMLRALSVIPMRKRNNQTSALQPLPLTRSNKLIDNTLRIIRKVTKLRFPHRQSIRRDERISELEAEGTKLGQRGVANDEARLRGTEVVKRDELVLVDLVVDHRMALGERTALDVLARHAYMDVLESQCAKGERLGG